MRRLLALAALGMVVACSAPLTGPDGMVTLSEFSVVAPASISGFTTVDLVNKGEMSHTLVVADAAGRVVTSSDVVGPGERGRLELDLLPGQYEFTLPYRP